MSIPLFPPPADLLTIFLIGAADQEPCFCAMLRHYLEAKEYHYVLAAVVPRDSRTRPDGYLRVAIRDVRSQDVVMPPFLESLWKSPTARGPDLASDPHQPRRTSIWPLAACGLCFDEVRDEWLEDPPEVVEDVYSLPISSPFSEPRRKRVVSLSGGVTSDTLMPPVGAWPSPISWALYDSSLRADPPGIVGVPTFPRTPTERRLLGSLLCLDRPSLEEWSAVWLSCFLDGLPAGVVTDWLARKGIDPEAAYCVQWRA